MQLLRMELLRFAPGSIFAEYVGSGVQVTELQSDERLRQLAEEIDRVSTE